MTSDAPAPLYAYARSPDQDEILPPRHKVVVIGAGPIGLGLAIDLAQRGVEVVVLDDDVKATTGARAICYARRPLEILDRLGLADGAKQGGVAWSRGKVFLGSDEIYDYEADTAAGYTHPPFLNLPQFRLERLMVERVAALREAGAPIELRGGNRVVAIGNNTDHAVLEVETPEGPYNLEADWVVACDGANSHTRRMLGLPGDNVAFEDSFLVADIALETDLSPERRAWFDPPFHPGRVAVLHKQPDTVWRVDFQLGPDADRDAELAPDAIDKRLRAMLGEDIDYRLVYADVHKFKIGRMDRFHHGRVLFAGDAAHQLSHYGARGASVGLQDVTNLAWKLELVLDGTAPETLVASYDDERVAGADANIANSLRSTDFITPRSEAATVLRDAVLSLARTQPFARPMVNSGRLNAATTYDGSRLNTPDGIDGPTRTRPGTPAPDAPVGDGQLLAKLGAGFSLLAINTEAPESLTEAGVTATRVAVSTKDDPSGALARRYLGGCKSAVYLIRPDLYVAARFPEFTEDQIRFAIRRATGKE